MIQALRAIVLESLVVDLSLIDLGSDCREVRFKDAGTPYLFEHTVATLWPPEVDCTDMC